MLNNIDIYSLGLTLDLIGVVLVFFFGIPPQINPDGAVYLACEGENKKEKEKAKKYDYFSRIGLLSIFSGFLLQIISYSTTNSNLKIDVSNQFVATILALLTIAIAYYMIYKLFFRNPKLSFRGQYCRIRQRGEDSTTHFWQFKLENNSKERIRRIEFYLPHSVEYWEIIQRRRQKKKLENRRAVVLKDLDPGDFVLILVWNLGTKDGDDAYLYVNKRIIYPEIYPYLD